MGTGTHRRSKDLISDREFFIQETFGGERCEACNEIPVVVKAVVYLPEKDVRERDPNGFWMGNYGAPWKIPQSLSSDRYFMFAEHKACVRCSKEMERMIATMYPSYAYAEFTRAPTDRIVLRVG